jgi:hypothetical protein
VNEPAIRDPEVIEGVVTSPLAPSVAELGKTFAAIRKAFEGISEVLRATLPTMRKVFHLVGHGRPAKCRICNPRGNPPPAPWAADYRRKTRNRNARRK